MSESTDEDGWIENDSVQAILEEHLDEKDYQIYRALNEDGRMSDTELGERIGFSRTAARRRREKLQEEGIIDVLAVLILQEADLAYGDVRVKLAPDVPPEEIESFIEGLLHEELIYEIDEYVGEWDLLIRVWGSSLRDVKRYVARKLQNGAPVADYELLPVVETRKAWQKVL